MHVITRFLTKGTTAGGVVPRSRAGAYLILFCTVAIALGGCDAGGGGTTVPEITEGIRLDQSSLQLDEGTTSRLRVLGTSAQVVWQVRDADIATVSDGLVTALKPGFTRVTASIAGKQSAYADLTVLAVPGSVEILAGDHQDGVVGEALSAPIRVRVLDRRGVPMSGAQVQFEPATSSGSVTPALATPGADGIAEAVWTLGTRAGAQGVDIRLASRNVLAGALSASAAPGPVAQVQVAPVEALTNPGGRVRYSAAALDQYGNVVPGARLEWQVSDPGIASIDADGTARALTAGETGIEAVHVADATTGLAAQGPGENRGKGRLKSKPGAGIPQQVSDLRVAAISTNAVTLSFTEVDNGFAEAADYQMRYAATPIGNGFDNATVADQGSCSSPIAGQFIGSTLTCRVEGLQSGRSYDFQVVAFNGVLDAGAVFGPPSTAVTAVTSADLAPALLEIIGGNNQVGPAGAPLASPISVRVKDALGQPMPNVTVAWAVTSGGGQVSSATSSTNSLGIAQTSWTLGAAGAQAARASVSALNAAFAATAQAPTVASIVVTPSSARVARGASMQLSAEPRDAQGRAIAGVQLTWTSTDATKATVSSSGQVTGIATGTATIKATSGAVEGSAAITVDDGNLAPASVQIVGGDQQSGTVGTPLPTTLKVRVNDGYGQPIANTQVSWTVVQGAGSLSAAQTITNAQGIAEAGWTLGSVAGTQQVRATAGSVSATFQATAVTGTTSGRPGTVNTLAADSAGTDRIHVRFVEVDDGTGHPANYSFRYHVSPMGWNWGSASAVVVGTCANLQGSSIGSVRQCSVGGLQSGVTYDVQVVAWRTGTDGAAVFSESLSNVATRTTLASGQGTLSIAPRSITLQSLGATQQLSATARDASGNTISNPGVTWTSSNTSIATVDSNGMLTARGVGTVVITAAAACCVSDYITVTVQQTVASVSVDPTSASIDRGQTMRLNATARDSNGNPVASGAITWQSSNTGVATVASDGTVRGESTGAASITASYGTAAATAAVSVEPEESPGTGGVWPNLPSGSVVAIDENFSSLTLGGQPAGAWSYAPNWYQGLVSIQGSNGPHSGPSAVRWTWPAGRAGGDSPGRAVSESPNMHFGSYYIGVWARWSKPWTNHASGVNKIAYWGERGARLAGHVTSQFMLNRRGNYVDVVLQWGQSYAGQPGGTDSQRNIPNPNAGDVRLAATSVDDGQWHRIEMVADASTNAQPNGRIRVWVDGILQFDVANVRYSASGDARFYGIDLDPVWGGIGQTKPQTEWLEMDHLRTGGR